MAKQNGDPIGPMPTMTNEPGKSLIDAIQLEGLSDELREEYFEILKKQQELQFLSAQKSGASDEEKEKLNKEYKEYEAKLNEQLQNWVYKKQIDEEKIAKDQIAQYRKSGDIESATKAQKDLNEWKSSEAYVDFSKRRLERDLVPTYKKDVDGGGFSYQKQITREVLDVNKDQLYSAFKSYGDTYVKEEEEIPVQEVPTQGPGGGGGYTYTQTSTGPTVVKDRPKVSVNANDMEEAKNETIIEAAKKNEAQLLNTEIDGPIERSNWTYDDGVDATDYILPAGQAIAGTILASQPLPDPTMSPEMRTIIDEDMARRNQGLTPDEIDYRNRQAERGYAYDVSNIRRMTGGSAGAALANLGRAAGTLQDQYSRTAAEDEAMRRQNQANARSAAANAENYERYAFGLDYQEAMMNAQAGAQLAATGFDNIRDTRKYQQQFGEGSFYGKRMEQLVRETEDQQAFEELARKNFLKLQNEELNKTQDGLTNQEEQTTPKNDETNIVRDMSTSQSTEGMDFEGLSMAPGGALLNANFVDDETGSSEIDPLANEADKYRQNNTQEQEVVNEEVEGAEEEVLENAPKGSYKKDDSTYVMDGVAYDIEEDDNGRFVNVNGNKQYLKKKVNSKAPFVGDTNVNTDFVSQLKDNEGFRSKTYTDSTGNETIGYGHKLDAEEKKSGKIYGIDYTDGLTEEESEIILKKDYESAAKYTNQLLSDYNIDANNLSENQYRAIQEMVYQLGGRGASKFEKTFNLIKQGKYSEAAKEVQKSEWYKQTPKRVKQFQDNIVKSNK